MELLFPVFGTGADPGCRLIITGKSRAAGERDHAQRRGAGAVGQNRFEAVVAVAHKNDGCRLAHRAAGRAFVAAFAPAFGGGAHELGNRVETLDAGGARVSRRLAAGKHAGAFHALSRGGGAEAAFLHRQGQSLDILRFAGSVTVDTVHRLLGAALCCPLSLGSTNSRQRQRAGVQIRHTQR